MSGMSEADWEALALNTLGELGWHVLEGKQIAPGSGERDTWSDLVLQARLRDAIARLNPELPPAQVDEAHNIVIAPSSHDAISENYQVHQFLTEGIRKVTYTDDFGAEHTPTIRLLSDNPADNDWLAVNQVTIVDGDHKRRFDVVLYVNGLPLAVFELKNAGDAQATLVGAHAQIQTYVHEFPLAFRYNMVCVVSDGITARYGTPFSGFEHYHPWNVDNEGVPAAGSDLAMNLVLHGLFDQSRTVELLRDFVAFAETGSGLIKRIAMAHQYFAVTKALAATVDAVRSHGLAGVVWHTQGSGKSMEMELYANLVLKDPALGNPTIVVITDRTDLDDQLYTTFNTSKILPEKPRQAARRDNLRTELANRTTGGIIFTTLQKFGRTKEERDAGRPHPLLSRRTNIIVIVDEAHRSHYDNLNGYARHLRDALPHATLIAFTGTPISKAERDTRKQFGPYIDIYDLTRAVEDGATVPVFFESRLISVQLPRDVDPETIDEKADEATAGLDDDERNRIQRAVAAINAVYGAPDRLRKLANDVVEHWETRRELMVPFIGCHGKAMIVCGTREICANLYTEIIALRPDWKDIVKVVYTGYATDTDPVRQHVRRPSENAKIAERMKDPDDPLEIMIVQSMYITGFDAPPLHTLYLDRSMRGAQLMQTLARVNRRFRDKQDALMVGYAPLTDNLYKALAEYTRRDQETKPAGREFDIATDQVRELHDTIGNVILEGYDWRRALNRKGPKAFAYALNGALQFLRSPSTPGNQPEEGEPTLAERFRFASLKLARFYAICANSVNLTEFRDDIAFFDAVRVGMAKWDADERAARGLPIPAEVELLLKQLTAGAIEAGGVKDIYEMAGMERPDLSHLNADFIAKMQQSPYPQLQIEALRRLVEQEMRRVTRHNVVQQEAFSARLIDVMRRYTNQNISAAQVIAELVAMAREVSEDAQRGKRFDPPLTDETVATLGAWASSVIGIGASAGLRAQRQNALRMLIAMSPDHQVC